MSVPVLTTYEECRWPRLQAFLRRCYPEAAQKHDPAYFYWRFRDSPLGSSLSDYVLLVSDEDIIGQAPVLRDRIRIRGEWTEAAWIVDLAVDPEHRGGLGAARMVMAVQRRHPVVLITGAGPHMRRFYESLGFRLVKTNRTLYAPLRPSGLVGHLTSQRFRPLLASLARAADAVLPVWTSLRAAVALRGWTSVEAEPSSAAMRALFDHLLHPNTITTHRDADVHRWRLAHPSAGKCASFLLTDPNHTIRCWFALKWFRRSRALTWLDIVDYAAAEEDRAAVAAMAWSAIRVACQARLHFVRFRCSLNAHVADVSPLAWVDRTREGVDDTYVWSADAALVQAFARGPFHFTGLAADRTAYGADEWHKPA
ncbi:MAG: GNAT family N-acetyltransferase [Polyangiaceae bacterium]|nr:GNAT family N-acetyltransferase [Polyangiaceae bacterium]